MISSINSSVLFMDNFHFDDEIIIIDDASTDNTCEVIQDKYQNQFKKKLMQYHRLSINKGVTFAKNNGAYIANNKWLIFLDSDDQLLPEARRIIDNAIKLFPEVEIFFFRCVDNEFNLIGPETQDYTPLSLVDFVKHGTYGECLPVIKKSVFLKYPYDDDLRGFEGLSYLKMLLDDVAAMVIREPVRKYSFAGEDRLSTRLNIFKRADKLLIGYQRYFLLSRHRVSILIKTLLILKIFKYKIFLILSIFR